MVFCPQFHPLRPLSSHSAAVATERGEFAKAVLCRMEAEKFTSMARDFAKKHGGDQGPTSKKDSIVQNLHDVMLGIVQDVRVLFESVTEFHESGSRELDKARAAMGQKLLSIEQNVVTTVQEARGEVVISLENAAAEMIQCAEARDFSGARQAQGTISEWERKLDQLDQFDFRAAVETYQNARISKRGPDAMAVMFPGGIRLDGEYCYGEYSTCSAVLQNVERKRSKLEEWFVR